MAACEESTRLEKTFEDAAEYLRSISGKLDTADLLYFYGRFKQAKEGPNELPKPGFFDFQGKQKWQAWKDLGDLSREKAMLEYVEMLDEVEPEWCTKDVEEEKSWIKVSSMMEPPENVVADADKTIFDWVKEGNLEKVQESLKEKDGVSVDAKDEGELGLLHWAADRGNVELVALLLDHGADVNMKDHEGQTALHYAASCGHIGVAKELLTRGVDKDVLDEDGMKAVNVTSDVNVKELLAED